MSEVTKAYGEFIRNKRTLKGMTQGEAKVSKSATFLPPEAKEKR